MTTENITLSVGAVSVQLPVDLLWSDELAWHPVGQSFTRSVNGKGIVQVQDAIGSRPITLEPPVEMASWIRRAEMEQLKAWADTRGQVMTLRLRGVDRQVIWRHHEAAEVIVARRVMPLEGIDPSDVYTATLKLMEL